MFPAGVRVNRRRSIVGLLLGVLIGAGTVAVAVGLLPTVAAIGVAVAALAAARFTTSPAHSDLGRRLRSRVDDQFPPDDEIAETRLGFVGHFIMTPRTVTIETFLATRTARIEDLVWAYGVDHLSRRGVPFLPDATLVLKFSSGAEVGLRCFHRQVTPAISAIRRYAGHTALGWDSELATTWEMNRAEFLSSVQARLGRVSGETIER